MTVSASDIARVRRMVNEPTTTIYSDTDIETIIEDCAAADVRGQDPYIIDVTTNPPQLIDNPNWIPTYDLYDAAAQIWDEKLAKKEGNFDFSADGGSYTRSQAYDHARQLADHYRSLSYVKSVNMVKSPKEQYRKE